MNIGVWFNQLSLENKLLLIPTAIMVLAICLTIGKWLWRRIVVPRLAKRRLLQQWREQRSMPETVFLAD